MDSTGAPDARIGDKRPREGYHSPARKRYRLVDWCVRAKEAESLMAAQMGPLKLLTGSPKRKNYQPKRRLQHQKVTANTSML